MRLPLLRSDRHCSSSAWTISRLSLLVVALGTIGLSGCGGHSGNPIDEDTFDEPINNGTVAANLLITINGSLISVCYTLADPQSDAIDITPEYSLDGGLTWLLATESLGGGSEGVVDLGSSPLGLFHCFIWDSEADGVGLLNPTTVIFRITPFDNIDPGTPGISGPFSVFNPPLFVDIGTDSGLFGTTGLVVPLTLTTGGTLPTRVLVRVSFDTSLLALNATPAQLGTQAVAAGALLMTSQPSLDSIELDIAAPFPIADGHLADVIFDSLVPATQTAVATPITCVSVTAFDASSAPIGSRCGASGSVFLFPNTPQSCSVLSPPAGASFTTTTGFLGDVQVGYSLVDPESEAANIAIAYSTDGGLTFSPATELVGAPSEGTMGLAASPTGISHIFTWDADLDIPTLTMAASSVILRITPSDAVSGVVGPNCTSGAFTIDLRNAPPTCTQPLGITGNSGNITVTFDVDDIETDNVDIFFEYESPVGSGFVPATAAGVSPLPNPAMSVPTPGTGLTFLWDSVADIGAVNQMVVIRITVGDAFNPLVPPAPVLNSCTSAAFVVDNTACVFSTLRVLGPGQPLGTGANMVTGGPTHTDPCTINANFTFSLGGPNRGRLTPNPSFSTGGNPLVFDDAGQMATIVVEGTFTGVCAGMSDLTSGMTAFGMTTYGVAPGPGGPYIQSLGNGMFRSLATAPVAQSGCDIVTVTFTPNGLGTMGGSNGAPQMVNFAACLDYFGWDSASREGMGLLPIGAFDGTMPGTASGEPSPGAGGSAHIGIFGRANPTDVASAFDLELDYDPAFLTPDTGFGTNGASTCGSMPGPWTVTPNPMFMGNTVFLANGFRITAVTGSSALVTMAFMRVAAGDTQLVGTQKEWADAMAMRIAGPQPLPWINPGISAGIRLP